MADGWALSRAMTAGCMPIAVKELSSFDKAARVTKSNCTVSGSLHDLDQENGCLARCLLCVACKVQQTLRKDAWM
jgi:hypothetical protein